MNVKPVNNNISFSRAIKITSQNNTETQNKELENILNGEKSAVYTPKETRKLRGFFREILGDYKKESPVLIRQNRQGDSILLSGKEAEQVTFLENLKQNERHNIWKKKGISRSKKHRMAKQTYTDISDFINKLIENGTDGKAKSSLVITSKSTPKGTRIEKIAYDSMDIEYSILRHGHMLRPDEIKSKRDEVFISSITYDKKTLDLKA